MTRSNECATILRLLGGSSSIEKMLTLESRFKGLEEGYSERDRWKRTKRRFGEILEAAGTERGEEGVKYCLVRFFLDALNHDLAWSNARKAELHVSKKFEDQMPPRDARLELLLMVQEDFPTYMRVAEELAAALKDREKEIADLCNYRTMHQSPLVHGR